MDFKNTSYLSKGNTRQQRALRILKDLDVFESFASNDPLVAGTIPIDIDLPGADLDLIMEINDPERFEKKLRKHFSDLQNFRVKHDLKRGKKCVIASFDIGSETIQVYGESTPVDQQNAYRHMVQEYRLLQAGGQAMKERIKSLKVSSLNTEEAFASLLELEGDPFEALLELEQYDDHRISELVIYALYKISMRQICSDDDLVLGNIIRNSFHDYNAAQEGTVFADKVIDELSHSFNKARSAYFVLEKDGRVLGGAGIQPLKQGPTAVCELQKMYIRDEVRGKRLGKALLEQCLHFAKEEGFEACYLESLPELKDALKMYEAAGFKYIEKRMGDTGYYGCSLFMLKKI